MGERVFVLVSIYCAVSDYARYLLNEEIVTKEYFYEIYARYGLGRDNIRILTGEEIQAGIEYVLLMTID